MHNWRAHVTKKYKQKTPVRKVQQMIRHGYKAKQFTWEMFIQALQKQGDLPPDKSDIEIGYALVDSDGFVLSPTLRQYIAMAWDDIAM